MSSSSSTSSKKIHVTSTPKHALIHSEQLASINKKLPPTIEVDDDQCLFHVPYVLQDHPDEDFDFQKFLDIALFLTLCLSGGYLVIADDPLGIFGAFGGTLIGAACSPLILSLWAAITGASLFRRQNIIKSLVAGVILSVGYAIANLAEDAHVLDWEFFSDTIGPALFDLGILFFISSFFLLGEDDETRIERLENQLVEARKSAGYGLALSYFYNFLRPTAAHLAFQEHDFVTMDVELAFRQPLEEYRLQKRRLYVFLPRNLDDVDIKQYLTNCQKHGVKQGKPKTNVVGHRPMFLYLLSCNSDEKTVDNAFDIPTVISSIRDRAIDAKKAMEEAKTEDERKEILLVDIPKEILTFQNALIELIESDSSTKEIVKVISTPSLSNVPVDELKDLIDHF